jgi:predicted PurR-regulated permease PerM
MWPGASPSAAVNGAAGMIIAALLIAALYVGRDLLMLLALAGIMSFVLAPLVHRLGQARAGGSDCRKTRRHSPLGLPGEETSTSPRPN